jgi:thiamine biosynthesis lipoprotein
LSLSFATWRAGGYANAAAPRRADPASLQQLAGRTMGTTWSLRFDNPRMLALDRVRHTVEAALARVVAQMSHWEAASDIGRFNRAPAGSRQTLPKEFAQVLACALQWAEASGGAIDPTIGPLIACWGFGPDALEAEAMPTTQAIAEARRRVGWQRLAYTAHDASLLQPGGATLDLSGIAKGFAVDHGLEALRELGLGNLLFEIGGELRGIGRRPDGRPWQVLVDDESSDAHRVALVDMAIATSGDRWHRRSHAGRHWSHTIDPRSGEPVAHSLAAVTVLHPQCMQADALATALTVLGPDEGFAFAQRHALAARFVQRRAGGSGEGHGMHVRSTAAWVASAPAQAA